MATKRKAYKPLYLAAQATIQELEYRLSNAKRELADINAALIPHGQRTLTSAQDEGDKITLPPLEFVAARAFLESTARIIYDNGGFSQNYTWRNKPIYRATETR